MFWDVTSCCMVNRFLRFVRTSYFHLQNRKFNMKKESVASSGRLAARYQTMYHIAENAKFMKPRYWNLQM